MNIEIIDFYLSEKDHETGFICGTMRIYLPEVGVHILGVYARRKNERWTFNMPSRIAIDHRSGKKVRYPLIVLDQEKQKELISTIKEQAPKFIEKKLIEPKPITLPPKDEKDQTSILLHEPKKDPSETKSNPKIPKRTWTDPPPIKRVRTASRRK